MREYNKIFKDFLSQIPCIIDENLLVEWYVIGHLQNICILLRTHEFKTNEEALKLAQHIEIDDDGQLTISSNDNKIKDKIEQQQNLMLLLTLQRNKL